MPPSPPSSGGPPSLLDRRLVIVSGKGGTGKTTVAAALAVAGAAAGRRVLVVEMGRDEQIPRLLDPDGPPARYAGRELQPGVRGMRIDPFEALSEYLGLQIGMAPLARAVVTNRGFRQLMSAAPGWRELITLGKVWHLEQMEDAPGEPHHDLIVVDAPATGHGVTFLDVPRVVVQAVRAGPLRRHSQWVEELIEDPDRTLLLPVALAEELPARETAELVERARDRIGLAVDRIVVNGVVANPYPEDVPDLDVRLARLAPDLAANGLPAPAVLAACAGYLRARHELNREYVGQIEIGTGLPLVQLPYLFGGVTGPSEIEQLSRKLMARPATGAA